MIDLHCHLLPGIDDGPATLEDSVALARAAAQAGTRTIVATPHVSWDYANDAETISALVRVVNERLRSERIPVDVRAGAEIAATRMGDLSAEQLTPLTLGGGGWILLEPPFALAAPGLGMVVSEVQARGLNVVVAHPERCAAFHRDRDAVPRLVAAGAVCSITAGSLVGRFGRDVRRFALSLLEQGLVHNVASDAHDDIHRPPGMAAELEQVGWSAVRQWATEEVPRAILAGEALPPRPPAASATGSPRRRWWTRSQR